MQRQLSSFALALAITAMSSFAAAAPAGVETFRGEISDSQCAMNIHSLSHSHDEMIQKKTMGTDAASCATMCVRRGGEWVLRSGDKVYHLKNQSGIAQFAGKNVVMKGTLDSKDSILNNSSIEPAPAK